jgi:hypothetical protein
MGVSLSDRTSRALDYRSPLRRSVTILDQPIWSIAVLYPGSWENAADQAPFDAFRAKVMSRNPEFASAHAMAAELYRAEDKTAG